jgi:serine/threonine protein kinase
VTSTQKNILIDAQGIAKICDFGLVRIFLEEGHSGHTTTSEHTGTDRYLAYELVTSQDASQLSTASDVYALGCIGLEVSSTSSPVCNIFWLIQALASLSSNASPYSQVESVWRNIPGHP